MKHVLFVCLGNICRSPAAEGILRKLIEKEGLSDKIIVTSCGLGDWHLGQLPDYRIRQAAAERGITLTTRAKPFLSNYLDEFDYVLCADQEVIDQVHQYAKNPHQKSKIRLMTHFAKAFKGRSIPDPYYAGDSAFDHILDILEDACSGLLEELKKQKEI